MYQRKILQLKCGTETRGVTFAVDVVMLGIARSRSRVGASIFNRLRSSKPSRIISRSSSENACCTFGDAYAFFLGFRILLRLIRLNELLDITGRES
jgi:hypothetical protein